MTKEEEENCGEGEDDNWAPFGNGHTNWNGMQIIIIRKDAAQHSKKLDNKLYFVVE